MDSHYLRGALVTAASVLLPIAGFGASGGREPGGARPAEGAVDVNGNMHAPGELSARVRILGDRQETEWTLASDATARARSASNADKEYEEIPVMRSLRYAVCRCRVTAT